MYGKNTKKVNEIKEFLLMKGWKEDRWGNFKKEVDEYQLRMKFSKSALRLEKKIGKSWVRVSSNYYKNLFVEDEVLKGLKR